MYYSLCACGALYTIYYTCSIVRFKQQQIHLVNQYEYNATVSSMVCQSPNIYDICTCVNRPEVPHCILVYRMLGHCIDTHSLSIKLSYHQWIVLILYISYITYRYMIIT
jgi:hypothetical protein